MWLRASHAHSSVHTIVGDLANWTSETSSEVGGCVRPGNLNGSCVRDPVAGGLEFD